MKQAQSISTEAPSDFSGAWSSRRWSTHLLTAFLSAITLLVLLSSGASAHATLARSDSAPGAVLDQAPSQVRLWFTEAVNGVFSKAVVVDPSNHEVDRKDSHVSSSNPNELNVSLPQLEPGAYIVVWKTVSAQDGHTASSSFLFSIRFPDGSVPALPGQLPIGPTGFSNTSNNQCLIGATPYLCLPQVLSEWVVFVMISLWIGGVSWQVFMVERAAQQDSRLIPTAMAAARRFRLLSFVILTLILLGNIGSVMGRAILAGGSLMSGFSPVIWGGILFHGQFGIWWLLREILGVIALLLVFVFPERTVAPDDWCPPALAGSLRMMLALLLLVALAFSGHAAAAQQPGSIKAFAIPVDWLHLLSTSLWVGGLLFIALTIFPASWANPATERAYAMAKLLPRFSGVALTSCHLRNSMALFLQRYLS